jgi:hypothetical protein
MASAGCGTLPAGSSDAQADELVRKDATPGKKGLFQRMRAAFG